MPTTPLVKTLARYVPRLVIDYAIRHPGAATEARSEQFPAAVLFADISGFSRLTEQLAQRGPQGVEELTRILNDYFGHLIQLVDEHGGDVVKFAGDALLAVWRAGETGAEEGDAAGATWRAAQCALAVQQALSDYRTADDISLSLRIAIGAGVVTVGQIGGVFNRWEFLIAGRPISQVGVADNLAEPGMVVLAKVAWTLIAEHARGAALAEDVMRLDGLRPSPPPLPLDPMPLTQALELTLRDFIPGAILNRMLAGQSDWLGELRRLTIIFVNLPEMDYRTPLELAQQIMSELQTAVYRYEGSINKLSVDDKGVTLIAALGLPPLAHEDDASRGVKAALTMGQALEDLGLRYSIGITTGRVYCGAVGSDLRREYTIVGAVVNLAARLMVQARGGVFCDAATYEGAQGDIDFTEAVMLQVKGKDESVAAYRPLAVKQRGVALRSASEEMIGRHGERQQLQDSLEVLLDTGRGTVVVIEGELGIGKTRLLEDFLGAVRGRKATAFFGDADAVENTTPYYAWQTVFSQLLGIEGMADQLRRREQVMRYLGANGGLGDLAPLLNSLLPLFFPESALTAEMAGEVRAANTEQLLVRLLEQAGSRGPLVVVLDDAQWLDSASWSLLRQVVGRIERLLLVLAISPMRETAGAQEYRELLEHASVQWLQLAPMTVAETLTLVTRRLGVKQLPESVAQLISERAGGHPLFSEELGFGLCDAGLLIVEQGVARMTEDAPDLAEVDLPDTIEGIITTRIDRLTPVQQLTLKVASVIGRVFSIEVLRAIYPVARDSDRLAEHLHALEALGISTLDTVEQVTSYIFNNTITQEVAYDLMLFAQRQELHRKVAEWYERVRRDDLSLYYPLLAHHWGRAGVESRAVDYLERSAAQALVSHASAEAVAFLQEARERDRRAETRSPPLRRARWHRMLGEAEWTLGHPGKAREHLERALAILGWPVPESRPGLLGELLLQAKRQTGRRFRPRLSSQDQVDPFDPLLVATRACEWLALIYYFEAELERFFYITLTGTNLAEQVGAMTPELARSYSTLALALGGIPWHAQVRAYRARALAAARRVNQASTWSWYRLMMGTYQAGGGRWPAAQAKFRLGLEQAERLGDRRRWHELMASLGTVAGIRGQFQESGDCFRRLAVSAAGTGDVQAKGWGLLGQGRSLCAMGWYEELAEVLATASLLLKRQPERIDLLTRLDFFALSARLKFEQGDVERAGTLVEQAVGLLERVGRPTQFHTLVASGHLAELALNLWLRGKDGGEVRRMAHWMRVTRRNMVKFERIFPVGAPQASFVRGQYALAHGRLALALSAWRDALAAAERYVMPYDEARICLAIAGRLPGGDPERDVLLGRGRRILADLGVSGGGL